MGKPLVCIHETPCVSRISSWRSAWFEKLNCLTTLRQNHCRFNTVAGMAVSGLLSLDDRLPGVAGGAREQLQSSASWSSRPVLVVGIGSSEEIKTRQVEGQCRASGQLGTLVHVLARRFRWGGVSSFFSYVPHFNQSHGLKKLQLASIG